MKLSQLLKSLITIENPWDREISGLSLDSRTTREGDVFFACSGGSVDGRDFIDHAIEKGAKAVICEETPETTKSGVSLSARTVKGEAIPIIVIPELSQSLGVIAGAFYGYPSQSMKMVGVTGTNGKTTCAQYIARALQLAGRSCGVMGTLGVGFPDQLVSSTHTTVDALTLAKHLSEFRDAQAEAVAMEVSSHGLAQYRVDGIAFDIAVFTNLTHDHLDYHGDFETYWQAKQRLFEWPGLAHAVVNANDAYGRQLLKQLSSSTVEVLPYYIADEIMPDALSEIGKRAVIAENIRCELKGINAYVKTPWGEGELKSTLLGRFNVSNLLAVLSVLCLMEVPLSEALEHLSALGTVRGRMQTLGGGKQPLIVVDYAHTPDALEKVLCALREHTQGHLWCVFGCGGNRDQEKRPMMGKIAERYSDQLVITNDNPRTEDPQSIVEEIKTGLLCPWAAEIEYDRGAAIAHAIDCAQSGDIVLIAGKGAEDYQEIGSERNNFSDEEQARLQLGESVGG